MSNKQIRYRVTDYFGLKEIGDIINAKLICEDPDNGRALIFHEPNENECGSFEICEQDKTGYYISIHPEMWININEEDMRDLGWGYNFNNSSFIIFK